MFKLRGFGGGLLLSFGIVAVAIGLLYVMPRHVQPYVSPETVWETKNFMIEYLKGSAVAGAIEALGMRFERELGSVLTVLQANRARLPDTLRAVYGLLRQDVEQALIAGWMRGEPPSGRQ